MLPLAMPAAAAAARADAAAEAEEAEAAADRVTTGALQLHGKAQLVLDDDGELQEDPAAGPRYSWQGMVVNGARGTKVAAAAPKRDAPRERSLTAPTAVESVFGAGADADLARHIENVAQSHHAEKRFAQR